MFNSGLGTGFYTEICACGHPVSRHELADTEYARCGLIGSCWCSGRVRVAARVEEKTERVNSVQSNARFFRRQFKFSGVHPLNGAINKSVDSGISVEWVAYECDLCGNCSEDFVAYMGLNGEPQIEVSEVTGETVLICGSCDNELKERLLQSRQNRSGVTLLEW